MRPATSVARRGLTLIEMIVVIAISGILSSIIMGLIVQARAAARTVNCMNNLRQIGTGLTMYYTEHGRVSLPQQPALPVMLASYITDERIFVCPDTPHWTTDSYSAYYVPQIPTRTDSYLLGCGNHDGGQQMLGAFGMAHVFRGKVAPVTWNGKPVLTGSEVTGGTLRFADGTTVTIDGNLRVLVVASFDEGAGTIYSAIRIPAGAMGSIEVQAAHGTHFDVATPACTAGVRGTKFRVTTTGTTNSFSTTVMVTEGNVHVEGFWPQPFERSLLSGQVLTCGVPDTEGSLASNLTVSAPSFSAKDVTYTLINDGKTPITVRSIRFSWPLINGIVREIRVGGKVINASPYLPPSLSLTSGLTAYTQDLTVAPGTKKDLKFRFDLMTLRQASAYKVIVE